MFKEGEMNKKGQVTMFVIIAIVIIVGGILVYQFAPGIKETISKTTSPNIYMQNCLEEDLILAVDTIAMNGGSIAPKNTYKRMDVDIGYLCYTAEYHKYCTKEIPFLEDHIEKELLNELTPRINTCFNSLKDDFTERGYTVNIKRGIDRVQLMSTDTKIISDTSISLRKGDTSIGTDEISVVYNNNLYQLLGIARSIIEFESIIGQAEPMDYMQLYRGIKVEKLKQTDGTKIYILTNKKEGDVFQFASRSLVFPPGLIDPIILK